MGNKSFSFTSHGERKDVRKRSGVLIYINVCITIKWIKWVLQVFSHRSAINYGESQPKSFNCLFPAFVLFCFVNSWLGGTDSCRAQCRALGTAGIAGQGRGSLPAAQPGPGAAGAAEEPCEPWGHPTLPRDPPGRKHQSSLGPAGTGAVHPGLFLPCSLAAWCNYCLKWREEEPN